MKQKIPYTDALPLAVFIQKTLQPYTEKIAIAGSVRRQKEYVGDIEIVAVPSVKMELDLFGNTIATKPLIDRMKIIELFHTLRFVKNGSRQLSFILDQYRIQVDLFLVHNPDNFGVILALRTGPAAFSKRLVTSRLKGGCLPVGYSVHDRCLWKTGQPIPTPTEDAFFTAIGYKTPLPTERGNLDVNGHVACPPLLND